MALKALDETHKFALDKSLSTINLPQLGWKEPKGL